MSRLALSRQFLVDDGGLRIESAWPWYQSGQPVSSMPDTQPASNEFLATRILHAELKAANDTDIAQDAAIGELRQEIEALRAAR